MKIFLEFEETEKMSNIGFAKALTDINSLNSSDLAEICNYLMIYSNARAQESLEMACVEYKRSTE